MIGIEWDVPASLTTTEGTLNFNTFPGLVLDPGQCAATKDVRAGSKRPVPQGDGDIIGHRWLTGYVYKLVVQAYDELQAPACKEEARLMFEDLGLHLTAMLNTAGRYCWIPSDYGDTRAMDEAHWFSGVEQTLQNGVWQASFGIDTPFPYVIDLTQQATTIVITGTITNAGNAPYYPVIQVQGPTTNFSLVSEAFQQIVYDGTRPGAVSIAGGDYAEIDTYKGTIFLNGDGADLSAGIDPLLTNLEDPFLLVPGVNNIESIGADSILLTNNAWA